MAQFSDEQDLYVPGWDWEAIARALELRPNAARSVFAEFGVHVDTLFQLGTRPGPGEPYGRRVLFKSDKYEVMLASWVKGAECAPHDHGFSKGLVWLAMGQFIENHYIFDGTLRQVDSVLHSEASSIVSVDAPDIHSMRAPHGGISLHVYNPPIHAMKVYDTVQCRTLTVSDDCGAWVPSDRKLIVGVNAWQKRHDLNTL